MPRPRTHDFWIDRIRVLLANSPGMSGAEIQRRLKNDQTVGREDAPTQAPSDRAIRRIMTEFKEVPENERHPYRMFSWPESMQIGALPWEASRAVLDYLRLRNKAGRGAPLLRDAQWFWYVTQAAPDAPIDERAEMALMLAAHQISGNKEVAGFYQWKLAYQPWRSSEDRTAYYEQVPEESRSLPPMPRQTPETRKMMMDRMGLVVSKFKKTEKGKPRGRKR